MKQLFITPLLLFSINCCMAQASYFKGEWTLVNKHDLFTGIFKIAVKKDGTAKAEIVWTYLATDSTKQEFVTLYKGKKGKSGIEYLDGRFDAATNDFYFEGKKKDDPDIVLGLDKYHIKLAANKQAIYGTTETEGTNEGLLYAVKITGKTGEKEFLAAKAKVKK